MSYQTIEKVDTGIITNMPASKVLWSSGRNVRFSPGYVFKTLGSSLLVNLPVAEPVRAIFDFKGLDNILYNIVCCDYKVYLYTGPSSFTDVTPVGFFSYENPFWQFALVGGLPILTDGSGGSGRIWKWEYTGVFVPLLNVPLGTTIANCMQRLIVGNIPGHGGRHGWSEIGNPEGWTVDRKDTSGYHDLINYSMGPDAVEVSRCMIAKGNQLYVYTDRNIWTCDFSQSVKVFLLANEDVDIISPKCLVISDQGNFAMGQTDFYSMSGGIQAIGFDIRNDCFPNLNQSAIDTFFAFSKKSTNEIWFCVATGTNASPDTAYVYNLLTKNWTILDCGFLCYGRKDIDTIAYDIAGTVTGTLIKLDNTDDNSGVAINGYIETGDMVYGDKFGSWEYWNKVIREVIPILDAQIPDNALMLEIGTRQTLTDPISWSPKQAFGIGTGQSKIDVRLQGKYIRYRFSSNQLNSPWKLSGFMVDILKGDFR